MLTFKRLTASRLLEVFLIANIRDMSHSAVVDLTKRVDAKLVVLLFHELVVVSLMWRVVDVANGFVAFCKYGRIFGQSLPFEDYVATRIVLS